MRTKQFRPVRRQHRSLGSRRAETAAARRIADRRGAAVARLKQLLQRKIPASERSNWLNTGHEALHGTPPIDLVEHGYPAGIGQVITILNSMPDIGVDQQ